jgi:signal transduction histidine kinase
MPAFLKSHFSKRAAHAALAERKRIARELHDGLAQELAFIALQSRRLAEKSADHGAAELADAADRALAESRSVIESLNEVADGSVARTLARTAERLAHRSGAKVELALDPRVEARPEMRHGLLRILQEAMSNGLRHGKADRFAVELSCDAGLRLRVADNGAGFDASRAPSTTATSFGLAGMSERARELGGELVVQSRPGAGTAVEVVLP